MARSRAGVKNSVNTASGLLLLKHRMMAGSSFYLLWGSVFAMTGSKVGAPGPWGGVGAELCRLEGVYE
jgi:hypothetical protein